jgi:hypothetical protein
VLSENKTPYWVKCDIKVYTQIRQGQTYGIQVMQRAKKATPELANDDISPKI